MKRVAALLLAGLLLLLPACGASQQALASRNDYLLYRATRTAKSQEEQLATSFRYLHEMPNGRYRRQVRAWFRQAEPRFFALAHDRPSLLKQYLRAMPDGPHAAEAAARLSEFTLLNQFRARDAAKSESFLTRVQADLAAAESSRQAVIQLVTELSRLLGRTRSFGLPTSELDHNLLYYFRLMPPAGHCTDQLCTKQFSLEFALPESKRLIAHQATIELRFELDRSSVARVSFGGPDLFSRVTEAVDRVPIAKDNLLGRTEAIARAVQLIDNAIGNELPVSECQREVVAPVVLARECQGVRLLAVAGLEPGQEDRVEIAALPTPPPPSSDAHLNRRR